MTEKCNVNVRRGYGGLDRLTREVRDLTRPVLGKRGFSGVDLIENWSTILGEDLAMGVVPVSLTFERDNRTNGTLNVKSAGGAFAMLFEHQKSRVIERINTYFGYPAVARIKIEQGAVKLPPPPPIVKSIVVPPDVQQALMDKVARIPDDALRQQTYEIGIELWKKTKK